MLIFYQNENNTSVYYDFLDDSKDQTTEDYLSQYGTNFTDLSRRGLLEQCFSRENEVYQIMETLVRKQKNNPVLIGEPGVGKTAIVELFADRIANKDVPFIFYDYEIIGIDITKMIGGSKFRGEFELRLNGIIEEILKENNIIVFLDELHILKGAGTTEGAIDAGNILKPALSRPGFRCLGASTPKEYKKIEEDAALNRRFQPIIILEPSKAETFEILDGMRTSLEIYHNVEYTDSALIEAINLSAKYIGDKTLPDKAVDLLDRAGSREVLFHTDINHVSIFDAILSNGIKKLSLLKLNAFRKGDIPTQFVLSEIEKAYKNLLLRWGQEQKNEKDVLIEKENFLTKFDSNAIEQDFDLLTIDTISYKKKNSQVAKNLSINLITKEIQYENFLNFFFLKNLKITNKAKKFLLKNFDNFLNQEKTNFLALLKKSIFSNEKKIVNNLLNIKKISRIIEPNIFLLFDFYKTILENLNFKIERKKKKLPLSLKTYNQKNLNHTTLFLKVNNYIYKIPQKNKKYLDIFNVLNTQENDSNKINLTKINEYKNTYRLIKNIIKPFSLQTKQSSFLKIISNAKNVNKKKNPFYLKTLSLAIENILIDKQLKRKEANIYKYSSIDNNVISLINTSIIQRVDDLLFFSNKPKFILDNKENIKNLSKKKNTENYKNLLDNFYNLKTNKNKQIKINQLKIKLLNPNSLISLYRIGLISLYKEIYEVGNLLSPLDRFIKEFYIIKWKTFYTFFSKYLYNYSNNLKEFNKIFFQFSSKKKNNTREYFINDIVLDFIDDDIQKTSILQKHLDDDNKVKIDILKEFFKLLPPLLHKKYIDVLTEESLSKKEQETFEKKDTSISFFQKEEENAILYNLLGFLSTEKGKNFLSNTNDPQLLRIARKIGNYKSLGLEYRVSAYQIQRLITNLTGIPVESLTANEMKKLINLENLLHKRIIGQNEAIATVSKAIRRSRLGIQNPNRPIGSFLFCGPTGVGKTELSKALTEAIFGSEKEMIRFDMSEFMERFSVTRLIGSPPGYVGYEEGGQLSDSVRKKPYSLVLFDEIEKAHIEVLNILLQILEDGRLTDSQKRLVSFENTIIIMTSNAAAKEIQLSLEMLEKKPNGKKDFSSDKTKLKRGLSEKTKNNTKKLKFFKKLGKNLYGDPRLGKISLISNKINTNFTVDIRDNIKQNFSNSYSSNFYINKLYSAFPEIKAFNIKKEKNKKLTILKNSEKLQSENQIENSLNQKIKGIKKTLLTNNSDQVDIKELVMNKLTKFFLPEFINRLDDIIVFESLTYEDIIKIYDVMVEKLIKRVRGNRINLIIDPSVKGKLVNEGYSKTFGARPLRRLVTKYLEDTLSNSLLNFQGIDMTKLSKQGCKVRISLSENDLIVGELIV